MPCFIAYAKYFGLYPKGNGKLLGDFEGGTEMIKSMFYQDP